MGKTNRSSHHVRAAAKITLFSVSYLALAAASANEVFAEQSPPAQAAPANESPSPPVAPAQELHSQSPSSPADTPAQEQPNTGALPQVTVEAPHSRPRPTPAVQTSQLSARPPITPPPSAPDPSAAIQAAWPASGTQDAHTGTVGVYANSTSVATKINTPLVSIPQSLSVVTREFISDSSFQNLTDITRYVPGVDVHQGEGNRDELIIRGVDSSANFFVNGFRDDVQYFRRNPEGTECDHLRARRRRRHPQPHPEGGRWPEDLRGDGADWIVLRPTLHAGRGASRQRERRHAPQCHVREKRHVPAIRLAGALGDQSDGHVQGRRLHQGEAELRVFPRCPHGRSRQPLVGPESGAAAVDAVRSSRAIRPERRPHRVLRQPEFELCTRGRAHRHGVHRP